MTYRKRIGAVQVSGFPLSSVVGMCIIVHSNAYREMNSLKKKDKERFICAAHGSVKGENKIIARSS